MYQQTLGRFLSRDPLAENGMDVMTDTGYFGERLAAMRANPWFYSGNGKKLYVYVDNNPVNLTDPSGLAPCAPTEDKEHWVNVCCTLQRGNEPPIKMEARCNTKDIGFSGFRYCCRNLVMINQPWFVIDMKIGFTCLEAFPPKKVPVPPQRPQPGNKGDCQKVFAKLWALWNAICARQVGLNVGLCGKMLRTCSYGFIPDCESNGPVAASLAFQRCMEIWEPNPHRP